LKSSARSDRSHRLHLLASLAVLTLAAGCGSVPLDPAAPNQFDLNGLWVLDADRSDTARPRGSRFLTQDFPLLVTREMRIEQDSRSMGIEYEGGSYRDVTWGDRRWGIWEVRAGWKDGGLYIFSEAPDISAVEIWRLSEDGDELTIDITVRGEADGRYQRVFTRSLEI